VLSPHLYPIIISDRTRTGPRVLGRTGSSPTSSASVFPTPSGGILSFPSLNLQQLFRQAGYAGSFQPNLFSVNMYYCIYTNTLGTATTLELFSLNVHVHC
jgi:hypothetical protein